MIRDVRLSCNLAILLTGPSVVHDSHVKSSITKGCYQRVTDYKMNLPGCASKDVLNGAVLPCPFNCVLAVVSSAVENAVLVP